MLSTKRTYIYVFFIFFILRVWSIQFGLPYDGIHPTENFSILQSLQYRTTGNLKPSDFQHPSLFQYLISLISSIIFLPTRNYPYFYLTGRVVSCLASFFSVYFLYRLTKELLNSKAFGLLCACFLGFNQLSIKYAHYAVPDSLCLVFIVLSITFSLKILENPSLKNYLLCGLFCGLSIGSKFSGLISLGFLFCVHLCFLKKRKKFSHQKLILGLLMAFLVFLLISPYHLFCLRETAGDFSTYLTEKGYFNTNGLKSTGFFTYPFILLPDTFGFLSLFFSLAGLGMMFLKDRKRGSLLFIPLLFYLLLIGKEKGGSIQHLLPILPCLSIFAAYFFLWLKERKIKRGLIVFLIILCLLPHLAKTSIFDYFLLKPDTRILAQDWLIKNVKEKARIGFERYTPFDLNYIGSSQVREKFNSTYFIPSLSLYPASFYKSEGYDYIVTSNFRQDSYSFFCRTEGLCQPVDNYSTYKAQLELAAIFEPPRIFKFTGISLPWGTWPHQPTVKIYKVKGK